MTITKDLGIWMDHSTAHLMDFTLNTIETKTIDSKFTHEEKGQTFEKSEKGMHNKENHQQREYYKKLVKFISNYTDVLLFGPTNAKTELFNLLRLDHHLEKINVKIKETDKLTENQQHAFVKEYFSKPLS